MAEALDNDFSFNRPIPGESLTAELGARPWQNPPQFVTVDDALGYYIPRMAQEEFTQSLINVMEMGVPLTSLANAMMMSGVMEGKHTVDVGILVMPSIIETMKLLGDSAGVEYETGMKEESSSNKDVIAQMVAERMAAEEDEPVVEEEPVIKTEEPKESVEKPTMGLMSRR